MKKILEIKNLSKKYQSLNGEIDAIKDISFFVTKGEFVSLVGPSGCGKSTLLSIISGLEQKTSGSMYINEKEISGVPEETGYMLQKDQLFSWRTILQNIMLGLEIKKDNTYESKQYALSLLKKYGLFEFKDKYPEQLSGGMRQRAALIRTLAVRPEILLLDEAFSALDYQTRLTVNEDIYSIIKEEGITAILVTHDIAESISMSDRVIVLSKRPAVIKNVLKIELTCEKRTPLSSRKAPEFREYFNKIWKELDLHV